MLDAQAILQFRPRSTVFFERADVANAYQVPRYIPGLDYLRGIAVLLVFLYHGIYCADNDIRRAGVIGLFLSFTVAGWLGVNLFFVLSGFLITGILLDSKSDKNYFKRFYERRARRILPAYLMTIAALLIAGIFSARDLLPSMLFLSNLESVTGFPNRYWPLWSLSLEEQFYLVWPLTIFFARTPQAIAWLSAGICIASPFLRLLSFFRTPYLGDVHLVTWLRSDNLAIGALMAVFLRSAYCNRTSIRQLGYLLLGIGGMLLLLLLPFGILHKDSVVGSSLQTVPWNLLFASSVLFAVQFGGKLQNAWPLAFLRFFGYISYGFYLIHQLLFALYDRIAESYALPSVVGRLDFLLFRFAIVLLVSIVAATLSRTTVEKWFLKGKTPSQDQSNGPSSPAAVKELGFQRS